MDAEISVESMCLQQSQISNKFSVLWVTCLAVSLIYCYVCMSSLCCVYVLSLLCVCANPLSSEYCDHTPFSLTVFCVGIHCVCVNP